MQLQRRKTGHSMLLALRQQNAAPADGGRETRETFCDRSNCPLLRCLRPSEAFLLKSCKGPSWSSSPVVDSVTKQLKVSEQQTMWKTFAPLENQKNDVNILERPGAGESRMRGARFSRILYLIYVFLCHTSACVVYISLRAYIYIYICVCKCRGCKFCKRGVGF